jgi:hypothetical protein
MLRFLDTFEQEGKLMRLLRIAAPAVSLFIFFVVSADAQRKPIRRIPPKQRVTAVIPPLDVRAAREKVGNQYENLNLFVDRFGPIAQAIETLDASAAMKRLPQKAVAQNEVNKQRVVVAIRELKQGLINLESEFRAKPSLQKYLAGIQGLTEMGNEAEDLAIAGKFVRAKDPLRNAARKLSDTLALMPKG